MDFLDSLAEKASPLQQILSLADALAAARVLLSSLTGQGGKTGPAVLLSLRGKKDDGSGIALDLSPILPLEEDGSAAAVAWYGSAALSLLSLVGQGLLRRSEHFASADEGQAGAQRGYLLLIEEVLLLTRAATSGLQAVEKGSSKGKGKRVRVLLEAVHAKAGELLERMHSLLSVPSFVAIIQVCMCAECVCVKRGILRV